MIKYDYEAIINFLLVVDIQFGLWRKIEELFVVE